MGNTAAKKRGDLFDLLLWQGEQTEKLNLLEQESDYPETIRPILRAYIKVFKPPSGAIPSRRQRKKFEEWVAELDQLSQVCPAHHEEIFGIALEIYESGNRFIIARPSAMRGLLVSAASEYNRRSERENPIVVEQVKEETEKLASPAEVKAAVKNLKSLLED